VTAIAWAGPHRGVKNDEVIAHQARAREASPGVIRIEQLEGVVAAATTCILRTQNGLPPRRRGRVSPFAHSDTHAGHRPSLAGERGSAAR
jgi:hypothetical protein